MESAPAAWDLMVHQPLDRQNTRRSAARKSFAPTSRLPILARSSIRALEITSPLNRSIISEFLTVKSLPSRYEEWSKIIISVKKTRYFDDYFQSIEGGLGDNIGMRVK